LPCSNSIQTPEPMMGSATMPFWIPAIGTQGMAQLVGVTPATSGT
jgi:hypothetical protein